MTLNEKIYMIRLNKSMSQAELAFKTGYSIGDIINFESRGNKISGYVLLKIIAAFDLSINEFMKI
jgi:transcriptional regulator with XRE-family HTH domain